MLPIAAQKAFEPLGVCRIDGAGAACWSTAGIPDADLTRRVDGHVREMKGDLAFVPKRKNRFLIVRQKSVSSMSATSAHGRVGFYTLSSNGPLMALRVDAPFEAGSSSIVAKVGVVEGPTVEIAFREGSEGRIGDVPVTLGAAAPSFSPVPIALYGARSWRFGVDRGERTGGFYFEPVARNGQTIRFVDLLGRPYDPKKGEVLWRQVLAGNWDWRTPPEADYARIQRDFDPQSIWYLTNVDPKYIAKLRVRRIAECTETLGPFALDPVSVNSL
ncbi:hypothetical protein EON82_02460 [bacterium]|nr:MAG: hypothetical protein EON82_02460 [bacterium]